MLVYRILDFLVVLIAWVTAYLVRFHFMRGMPVQHLDWGILLLGLFVGFLSDLIFSQNNLYTSQRYFSWHKEILSVLKSHFQTMATVILLLYLFNPSKLSRIMLLIFTFILVLLSLTERLIFRAALLRQRRKGHNLKHIVLMGNNPQIRDYAAQLIQTPELGLRITGWLDSEGLCGQFGISGINSIEDIPTQKNSGQPDAIIMGYNAEHYDAQNYNLAHYNRTTIPVWILPDIKNTFIGYTIESFHGIPLIKFNGSRLSVMEESLKRFVDILGSFLGLVIFSPLMVLIALIIKITSPGPVFYGQERITYEGSSFTMWKFRSMPVDAEKESGAVWNTKTDKRATPFGAVLRKTSLDELPQLWNILKGDMSLVGPRPERPVFVEQFRKEIPAYMLRHKMKAGLTGWAQVNGWRGNTSLEKRIEFDLYYIQNWSLGLDMKILLLTVLRGFVNKNAY